MDTIDIAATEISADTDLSEKVTRAWKGFDQNLCCRRQKYEVGQSYEIFGNPILCERGFHACTVPVDALTYYGAATSRYAEVELIGNIDAHREKEGDSKLAASKIRIIREISYFELWQAQRAWMSEAQLEAAATGDRGHAAATGDRGHAAATGDRGHAAATGENSIAAAFGIDGRAKGAAGNWIVLAHYADHTDNYRLLSVKTAKCGADDGELRPDVWYRIDAESGEFVECAEDE